MSYTPGYSYNSVDDTIQYAKENRIPIALKFGRTTGCQACRNLEGIAFSGNSYEWLKTEKYSVAYIFGDYNYERGQSEQYEWACGYTKDSFGYVIVIDPVTDFVIFSPWMSDGKGTQSYAWMAAYTSGYTRNAFGYNTSNFKRFLSVGLSYVRHSANEQLVIGDVRGAKKTYITCPCSINVENNKKKYGVYGECEIPAILVITEKAIYRDIKSFWYVIKKDAAHGIDPDIRKKPCEFEIILDETSTVQADVATVMFYNSLADANNGNSFVQYDANELTGKTCSITPDSDELYIEIRLKDSSAYKQTEYFCFYLTTQLISSGSTFSVTFKDLDGNVLKTQTVTKGNSATPPEMPQKDGYKIVWKPDYNNVQSDLTCIAQYVSKSRPYENPRYVSEINRSTTLFKYTHNT